MAVQKQSNSVLNINYQDNCKNKVYINPNFNKSQINNLYGNSVMHVNPKFSHFVSNVQNNSQNKNKIYVNPNFIKSRSFCDSNQTNLTPLNNSATFNQNIVKNPQTVETERQQLEKTEISTFHAPIAKSRYSLVRQSVNKPMIGPATGTVKNTFKINKYKTVPWNDIKRNLDTTNIKNNNSTSMSQIASNSNPPTYTGTLSTSKPCASKTVLMDYKQPNYTNITLVKHDRIKSKLSKDPKKVYKVSQMNLLRVKKLKGNLKKNNIPCPLYRKFGKCLRNEHGRCEFLHDKKHVSVCRKFIKGLCHDKECLLSHDLTSKKMPTCYFYLQGTCTKADCPYLHVKLNDKAKLCLDFLKGYCEKGSKCLQRHVNIRPEKKNKRTSLMTNSSFKSSVFKSSKIIKKKSIQQDEKLPQYNNLKSEKCAKLVLENSDKCSEHRYYQELQIEGGEGGETCEIIKPLRCKLGTLPSFIQL